MTGVGADSLAATGPNVDDADAVGPGADSNSVMIDGEVHIIAREKQTYADSEIYYT